jgi:hypothetical protein
MRRMSDLLAQGRAPAEVSGEPRRDGIG